jgi:hypothetical protein
MKNTTEILTSIFSMSPLPNRLKKPKQDWLKGKLGATGAIRIIEEYSEYKCTIICEEKSPAE